MLIEFFSFCIKDNNLYKSGKNYSKRSGIPSIKNKFSLLTDKKVKKDNRSLRDNVREQCCIFILIRMTYEIDWTTV